MNKRVGIDIGDGAGGGQGDHYRGTELFHVLVLENTFKYVQLTIPGT